MKTQAEDLKYDVAVQPVSLATTNTTGRYFGMRMHRRAVVMFSAGAMASGNTVACQLREATDAAGSSAQDLAGAAATITAPAKATAGTLTLASVAAPDAVTVNGLTFTAHATTTTKSARQFSIASTDAADAVELAACINDPAYGVLGLTASPNGAVVTLTSADPGHTTVSITSPAATITAAVTQAVGYVEIERGDMSAGFTHVAAKLTTAGTVVVSAVLLRSEPVGATTQAVAAAA
jgi:hypothetical protein